MKKVAIVDYHMGNLDSIARAVEECGETPIITNNASDFKAASNIILPGVGAFSEGMANIRKLRLDKMLREEVLERKTPLLGICLGMQLLAERGFEGGENQGLGFIKGEAKRLELSQLRLKVPHIGWNEVFFVQQHSLFKDIPSGKDFYFVHSYHFVCSDDNDIFAHTSYCGRFNSVVCRENIFGVQFHPEKSQRFGLQMIRNFLSL